MALYLPIRAFNRSQQVRIGGQKILSTTTAYVDLSVAATKKEFSYHSAIGAVYPVGPLTASNNNTGRVVTGGVVSEGSDNTDLLLAVTAGEYRGADGVWRVGAAATTVTISAAPSAGNKRIDLVSFKLSDQTYVVTAGTVVANAATASAPSTPTGNVPLATVAVASAVTAIVNANITDVRPRP